MWRKASTSVQDKLASLDVWMRMCQAQHPSCQPSIVPAPKRLIEVGSREVPSLRLVKYDDYDAPQPRYSTLSYVLGKSKACTTRSNVESHERSIVWENLPLTHQNAITITRSLGIPYLWIDSLCIVQDDALNMHDEIARMHDIYSGSTITIAATDGDNASAGCFPSQCYPVASSPVDDGTGFIQDGSIFATTETSENNSAAMIRMYRGDSRQWASKSILNTRGWVLQEVRTTTISSPLFSHNLKAVVPIAV